MKTYLTTDQSDALTFVHGDSQHKIMSRKQANLANFATILFENGFRYLHEVPTDARARTWLRQETEDGTRDGGSAWSYIGQLLDNIHAAWSARQLKQQPMEVASELLSLADGVGLEPDWVNASGKVEVFIKRDHPEPMAPRAPGASEDLHREDRATLYVELVSQPRNRDKPSFTARLTLGELLALATYGARNALTNAEPEEPGHGE